MQTKFTAKRVGTLNKFFTKVSVGEILAGQIDGAAPDKVLDLGAGEGSLSASVIQRWPHAGIVSVDLDPSSSNALKQNIIGAGCNSHHHYVSDALDPSVAKCLLDKHGQFDVAVCNPPFFRPEWNRSFADILRCGDLSDAARTVNEVTAEVLFIAQSLSLLKPEGRLAVIVPDSLITTERARHFRSSILRNHLVEKVLQLPINSFMETDAQCYIVLVKKGGGPTSNVQLYRVEDQKAISAAVTVSTVAAENRMDFNFHSLACEKSEKHINLRALGAEVFRGSISTVQRKTATFPVFHTSEYSGISDGRIMLPESGQLSQLGKIVAEPGDILLARVDRNLHEKIGIVVCGSAAITDCVYRIRLPEQNRQIAFDALCSDAGRRNLRALTKGVSARIIGKANLLDMPLAIERD